MDRVLNNSVYQLPSIFPTPDTRNPTILVERGLRLRQGAIPPYSLSILFLRTRPMRVRLAVHVSPPRYTYDEPPDTSQGSNCCRTNHRSDNITDEALDTYRARYGEWVTKDHIFSYVYGILHSPDYRERYADDLARLLPRIPEVARPMPSARSRRQGSGSLTCISAMRKPRRTH